MVLSIALVLVSLFGLGLSSSSMRVHDARNEPPPGFTRIGPPPSGTLIKLRIALKQTNMEGLIKKLYDLSTPGNENYTKWLSAKEVRW